MKKPYHQVPPQRGEKQETLAVFLGEWQATGESYGDEPQSKESPRARPVPWISTHRAYWYSGQFFLVQDERATTGGKPFDTLFVMGVEPETGAYFAQTFENHGFQRRYDLTVAGRVWTLSGESERARIEFSEDGKTQTIHWEWRPEDGWLPLCDRVAVRR